MGMEVWEKAEPVWVDGSNCQENISECKYNGGTH